MKRIILAVACVGLAGGVASADRFHGGGGRGEVRGGGHAEFHGRGEFHGGGGLVVRDHRYEGGVHVTPGYRYNGGYRNNGGYRYNSGGYRYNNYERRPIYMARPIIRERYYDYRYRPELIVENYGARPGYYWVAGAWQWSGYEWIWQPGHYEPDPNYVEPDYVDPGYSVGVGVGVGY
jgi:hypothetical protein